MDATWLTARIAAHLRALVEGIGPRPPGSPANRHATDYAAMVLRATGLDVREDPFTCRWWEPGPAGIEIGGSWFDVQAAPFSRACMVRGRVTRLSSEADLERAAVDPGRILVLDGDLTAESYFPKAFPFLDLPEQRARIARLEALRPAAVVSVVPATRAMPVFEDGDLEFPYLSLTASLGDRIRDGRAVGVRIGGALHEGAGVNLAAMRAWSDGPRVVLSAHLDTEATSPGAFDNGSGVATLLALAEAGLPAAPPVEVVLFNGEDHYQAPGEVAWLAATDLASIAHVVNLDGVGVVGRHTSAALLAGTPAIQRRLEAALRRRPGWELGESWFESDHAIFAMRGIPSLALTSAGAHELMGDVIHSERDVFRVVDTGTLTDIAGFLGDWLPIAWRELRPA